MRATISCFLLCIFVLSLALADEATLVEIALRPVAVVSGPDVRLGDIATVSCDDQALAQAAGQTVVLASPPPGQSARVVAGFIAARLRPVGFLPQQLAFTAQGECVVTSAAQYLTQETIEQRLAGELALTPDPVTGSLLTARFAPFPLPEGELRVEVQGPLGLVDGNYVRVRAFVEDALRASWLLKLAQQPAPTGPAASTPTGSVTATTPGKQVRGGTPVRLVVRAFGLELTTAGKLRVAARVGEPASALNLSSGREVQGVLEAPDLLVVTLNPEEG